jgi:hypothetical protein
MKQHKDHYSERFIVSDSGDWSVGIQAWDMQIDVICPQMGDEDMRQEFTKAMKEFLVDFFQDIQTQCQTMAEIENENEQNRIQAEEEAAALTYSDELYEESKGEK